MKRGLIIAIVVGVLLYPAGAWLMGYAIEHRVDAFAQQFNESNPYVRVSGNQFHRGWYVSNQELTLEPAQAALGAGSIRVIVHNVIHHGPLCGLSCIGLARIDTHLEFSPQLQQFLTSIFGTAEPLSITSRLGLFGGGSARISSPAISDALLADGHFSSDGVSVKSDYGANLDSYSLQGSIPRLAYHSKDDKRFEVADIQADIRSNRTLRSLYTGDSSASIAQMAFANGAGPGSFTASDFRLTSHNSVSEGFYTAAVKYSIAAVSAGPIALTGVNLDLTFQHMDADSLERLSAALQGVNRDATIDPQEHAAKMLAAAKSPAIELLAKQPEIKIEQISASTASGTASISGLVKFLGVVAADFDTPAAMKDLVKKVDTDLDVTVDDGFLKSLPGGAASLGRLQPFIAQGMATHDGGKFHTTLGFHAGQVSFNGKAFGPPTAEHK